MRAVIDWIPEDRGGRRILPTGIGPTIYSPVVRFMDEPWPGEIAWSFAVVKVQAWDNSRRWLADVAYRVEHAPHDQLREGREFELYEGPRCVARGRTLAETDQPVMSGTGASTA